MKFIKILYSYLFFSFSTRSAFLHRLLRSELVKTNEVALSSDAFTGFASPDDPDRISNMHEVSKATQRLIKIVIPSFAHELNSHRVNPVDHKELIGKFFKIILNLIISFFRFNA